MVGHMTHCSNMTFVKQCGSEVESRPLLWQRGSLASTLQLCTRGARVGTRVERSPCDGRFVLERIIELHIGGVGSVLVRRKRRSNSGADLNHGATVLPMRAIHLEYWHFGNWNSRPSISLRAAGCPCPRTVELQTQIQRGDESVSRRMLGQARADRPVLARLRAAKRDSVTDV